MKQIIHVEGRRHEVVLTPNGVEVDGTLLPITLEEETASGVRLLRHPGGTLPLEGRRGTGAGTEWILRTPEGTTGVVIEDLRTLLLARSGANRGGDGSAPTPLRAPMPGLVAAVRVAEGDRVDAGEPLLILEAMKMENEIVAPRAGRIGTIQVGAGETVAHRQLLLEILPDEGEDA